MKTEFTKDGCVVTITRKDIELSVRQSNQKIADLLSKADTILVRLDSVGGCGLYEEPKPYSQYLSLSPVNYINRLRGQDFGVVEMYEKNKVVIESDVFGTIDYYPKSDRLLLRKKNEWLDNGLKWMESRLLQVKSVTPSKVSPFGSDDIPY